MDFVFCDTEEYDAENLRQGDILARTDLLSSSIAQAHQYYATAQDYSHFIILTQSCDLVRRQGLCRTNYITLAAARPVPLVLQRFVEKYRDKSLALPLRVCDSKNEMPAKQFLERLVHHTADGYFFIRKGSLDTVTNDLCVFLPLSIALRSASHYDACLKSKVGQMKDIFAAKLGWLTGNLYSRVGTPDIADFFPDSDNIKTQIIKETIEDSSIYWLSKRQIKILKANIDRWQNVNVGVDLTEEVLDSLISEIPDEASIVAETVIKYLSGKGFINNDGETLQRATKTLANFPTFFSLAKAR